jgi:hypothetical protein
MRADTASITTPARPERNFAVTIAIVPVTTAIAQSKIFKKYGWEPKKRREKNSRKKQRKKKTKNKTFQKNEKTMFFYIFMIFQKLAKRGGNLQKRNFGGPFPTRTSAREQIW